ncbi:MAG: Trk system potassium transporter TrkA [Faecalibacterium sp.]|nr:Trk system potassium transporter TrkA [Faecalibacterium sp.]
MQIILVGSGKVGVALARQLSEEGHSVTVIDTNENKIQTITEELDVMGYVGNGSSISVLSDAGLEKADVLIAVTGSDEMNLLCCLFAKKSGRCHTIARVRNPAYSRELDYIKEQLGISAIINSELAAAREITRLLQFPAASKIDTFADGRVQLIKFVLQDDTLDGVALKEVPGRFGDVLICAVERDRDVVIPGGNFMLKTGDVVTFLATPEKAKAFFETLGLPTKPVHSAMIVGGGAIGHYLAQNLVEDKIPVRIIEKDAARCEFLADQLPQATILHGDGGDRRLLQSEGIGEAGAFVALTNQDEENVLLGLYSKKHNKNGKVITKLNRLDFDDVLDNMDLGSLIYPKYMTCDYIVQYVRALQNSAGSKVKTLYRILDDRVEALEFKVEERSDITDIPLYKLKLKPNLLICCITRGEQIIIPRGADSIRVGDSVVVVTLERGLKDVRGIAAH